MHDILIYITCNVTEENYVLIFFIAFFYKILVSFDCIKYIDRSSFIFKAELLTFFILSFNLYVAPMKYWLLYVDNFYERFFFLKWLYSALEERVIPLTGLTPPYLCACPSLDQGFHRLLSLTFLCLKILGLTGEWFVLWCLDKLLIIAVFDFLLSTMERIFHVKLYFYYIGRSMVNERLQDMTPYSMMLLC